MPEIKVLLVRHGMHDRLGHTLCGRMPDVNLGEAGKAQARTLGRHLSRDGVTCVQTSPLERCRQTAAILAEPLSARLETAPGVAEIDFGCWTGRRFEDLLSDPAWRVWNESRDDARAPGGESAREAQARALRHIGGLREQSRDGVIAVVSHADVIKAILCHALGLPLQAYARFEISPGSVSRLLLRDDGAVVASMNEVPPP